MRASRFAGLLLLAVVSLLACCRSPGDAPCAAHNCLAVDWPEPEQRGPATDGPGTPGSWTSAAKEGVGTAASDRSRVWFTLQGGVLTEVYYPRLDVANVRTLELVVADGRRAWFESGDLQHELAPLDERALIFRQTSRHPQGLFTLRKTTITDPQHDALLIEVELERPPGARGRLDVYVVYDPSLNNTATGDTGFTDAGLLAFDGGVASALLSPEVVAQTSGFAGAASDPRASLRRHGRLLVAHTRAAGGDVVQALQLRRGPRATLALAFGPTPAAARQAARDSLRRGFAAVREDYVRGWHRWLARLRQPRAARYGRAYRMAAMVLRAHEDKTHRGAMIASLSIPWGTRLRADRPDIGGYHLVWSRDLYHVATAFLALGDRAAAERALDYVLHVQQRPDGSVPQNTWLDGRPHWTAIQLDQVAYPLILAWQLGRRDARTTERVRRAADYLVAHGPATPQERWEEESGYSPSTIAAAIAGLVCAATLVQASGDGARADRYLRTADHWAANVERWTVTRTGTLDRALPATSHARGAPADSLRRGGAARWPLPTRGYYIRLSDDADPDDGAPLEINNGGGTWDEREVVDAGFLELVRLGIKRPDDPLIVRSLAVVDATLRVATPRGVGFYRYNHDGYGEHADGRPYDGRGVGRLWPLLSGERGEYEIAAGRDPRPYLDALLGFANAGGMIPEQVWDRPSPTAHGFRFGAGTGAATPLAWSMAQLVRLVLAAEERRVVEQPAVVAERYLRRPAAR